MKKLSNVINVYQYQYSLDKLNEGLYAILTNGINKYIIDRYYRHSFSIKSEKYTLNDEMLCEKTFEDFNASDRPNETLNNSLSRGDLIEIDGAIYLCDVTGFIKISLDVSDVEKHSNYKIY